jgi:hypothetical protein
MISGNFEDMARKSIQVADEINERYGKRKNFAGWYQTFEFHNWIAAEDPLARQQSSGPMRLGSKELFGSGPPPCVTLASLSLPLARFPTGARRRP